MGTYFWWIQGNIWGAGSLSENNPEWISSQSIDVCWELAFTPDSQGFGLGHFKTRRGNTKTNSFSKHVLLRITKQNMGRSSKNGYFAVKVNKGSWNGHFEMPPGWFLPQTVGVLHQVLLKRTSNQQDQDVSKCSPKLLVGLRAWLCCQCEVMPGSGPKFDSTNHLLTLNTKLKQTHKKEQHEIDPHENGSKWASEPYQTKIQQDILFRLEFFFAGKTVKQWFCMSLPVLFVACIVQCPISTCSPKSYARDARNDSPTAAEPKFSNPPVVGGRESAFYGNKNHHDTVSSYIPLRYSR